MFAAFPLSLGENFTIPGSQFSAYTGIVTGLHNYKVVSHSGLAF